MEVEDFVKVKSPPISNLFGRIEVQSCKKIYIVPGVEYKFHFDSAVKDTLNHIITKLEFIDPQFQRKQTKQKNR